MFILLIITLHSQILFHIQNDERREMVNGYITVIVYVAYDYIIKKQ